MTKSLNDILKRFSDAIAGKRESTVSALTTGENPGVDYADKMKDGRDFVAQHSVEKHADRVGNGDDVYDGSKIKKAVMARHGHEPKPKDIKVYNKTQQQNEEVELDEAKLSYDKFTQGRVTTKDSDSDTLKDMIKKNNKNRGGGSRIMNRKYKEELAKRASVKEEKEEAEQIDELSIYKMQAVSKEASRRNKDYSDPKGIKHQVYGAEVADDKIVKKAGKYDPSTAAKIVDKVKDKLKGMSMKKKMAEEAEQDDGWYAHKEMHGSKAISKEDWKKGVRSKKSMKKEDVEQIDEAKCNMTEAGKMCEVHGTKACPSEGDESAENKEPRYSGKKDKSGKRQLITDKKIQEMATSQNQAIAARIALKHKKEGTMPPKGTASHSMMDMSAKQFQDYTHAEKGAPKKVDESISDQRSSRATASEEARKQIHKAFLKRKEKMKEESAAADTPVTFPVTNSREGFRV